MALVQSEGTAEHMMAVAFDRWPVVVEKISLSEKVVAAVAKWSGDGVEWSCVCLVIHAAIQRACNADGRNMPTLMSVLTVHEFVKLCKSTIRQISS